MLPWLVAACGGWGWAVSAPAPRDEVYSLREWMKSTHSWAISHYQRFEKDSRRLSAEIDQLCAQPDSDSALTHARDSWARAMNDWRTLEVLQLGPTLQRRSSKTMDFWPTRPSVIEMAVEATRTEAVSGAAAEDSMQRWGTAAKGLPAMEWLLFPDAGRDAVVPALTSPAHCLYARRVARGVVREASILVAEWKSESRQLNTMSETQLRKLAHDTLNLMVGSCELLRGKKVQKGVRLVAQGGRGSAPEDAFDSVRSGRTRELLLRHFEALSQVMLGQQARMPYARGGPKIAFRDFLLQLGHTAEADSLSSQVDIVHSALLALPANPREWTLENTQKAADALGDLRAILDPRISELLGITVTFTDADGD